MNPDRSAAAMVILRDASHSLGKATVRGLVGFSL